MISLDDAVDYHYDKFPPQKLDYTKFINELLEATSAISRYDQMLKNMHNSEILLSPLRNQEAVISSRIEGTISTMDEILTYEAEGEGEQEEKFRPDVIEATLYQRALKNAQGAMLDGYEISTSLIKQLHQQLLSFGRGANKAPGKFKDEQNFLADKIKRKVEFIPISSEKLDEGFDNLFAYLNNSEDPILVKTALMHLEFEALHPFKDGNGRIGRMLITLYLWKAKIISQPHFYISGFLEENKDMYIATMRKVSENGDWEQWCKFFLTAVEKQAVKNLEVAESIRRLYNEMKQVFAEVLASRWSVQVLDFVFANPIFRNNKFTNKAGIPVQSATKYTKKLLDEGLIVVKQEASGRRPALYSFEPLMRLVRV